MNYVSQHPYPKACQQACIAMIAGVTLEEVLALAPTMPMDCGERQKVLEHFGIETGPRREIEVFGNYTMSCLMRNHKTVLFSIFSSVDLTYGHEVVWHNGTLYDPQHGLNPSYVWHYRFSMSEPVLKMPISTE